MTEMGKTFGGLTLLIKSYSEVFGTWLNNFAFGAKPFIIFYKEMPAMAFFFQIYISSGHLKRLMQT